MTIDDLLYRLEEYKSVLGGETEVRLMTQEQWPFENEIVGLCSQEEMNDEEEEDEEGEGEGEEKEAVLYLVEGDQLGYGSKRAWLAAN